MTIAIYMFDFIYRYGGAEGYAATLIELFQNIFSNCKITIFTELYKNIDKISNSEFIENLNNAYGLKINDTDISISYISTDTLKDSKHNNKLFQIIQFLKLQKKHLHLQRIILSKTQNFDLFVNCAQDSLHGNAKKNITLIHFPREKMISAPINQKIPYLKSLSQKHDLNYVLNNNLFIPNSNFTSYWLTQKWDIPEEKKTVIYPPVTMIQLKSQKHKGQICICSRIEASKKIDLLLSAYENSDYLKNNCHLVVMGSIKQESSSYIESIKKISPSVEFHFNPSRTEIEKILSESEIFWHAKGIDENDPRLFEHFGITTVEAMSAGCVPIVINKGGQQEIVTENCGFKFNTLDEMISYTEHLMKNPVLIEGFREQAIKRSEQFSKQMFKLNFEKILSDKLNIR